MCPRFAIPNRSRGWYSRQTPSTAYRDRYFKQPWLQCVKLAVPCWSPYADDNAASCRLYINGDMVTTVRARQCSFFMSFNTTKVTLSDRGDSVFPPFRQMLKKRRVFARFMELWEAKRFSSGKTHAFHHQHNVFWRSLQS